MVLDNEWAKRELKNESKRAMKGVSQTLRDIGLLGPDGAIVLGLDGFAKQDGNTTGKRKFMERQTTQWSQVSTRRYFAIRLVTPVISPKTKEGRSHVQE